MKEQGLRVQRLKSEVFLIFIKPNTILRAWDDEADMNE